MPPAAAEALGGEYVALSRSHESRKRAAFPSAVNHELRAPLTSIKGSDPKR